jgi:hypothetical protein
MRKYPAIRMRGMIDRSASVDSQPDGRAFVFVWAKTTDGMRISEDLPEVLPSIDDATALGEAVVSALARSTTGVLPARDLRENPPDRAFLRWVGTSSFTRYMRGVRMVGIWAAHGVNDPLTVVEVVPKANSQRDGFVDIDAAEELDYISPRQLGEAIQRAFLIATA